MQTSPQSIDGASNKEISRSVDGIVEPRDRGPSAITSATLEAQLAEQKAERKVERLFWTFALLLFWFTVVAKDMNYFGTGVVGTALFVFLLGLAHWWEVSFIVRPLEACLVAIQRRIGGRKDTE